MIFRCIFMILHLIIDHVFTDYAISQFSVFSNTSEFVLVNYNDIPVKCVKQLDKVRVLIYGSNEYISLLNGLDRYTTIISHGLFDRWQHEIILATPKSVKIAWMFWGGEVYGLAQCRMQFLSTSSKFLFKCKEFAYWIKRKKEDNTESMIPMSVFKRINFCLTDDKEECNFANRVLGISMCHLWYNYYNIEETIGILKDENISGKNILLGNASTFEANHLMMYRILSKMDLLNRKVIVPLSYGDSWLRPRLLELGRRILGKNFQPLTAFLPLHEYNSILQSCSVVIMPHYRPHAVGNILTSLWLGAKVFISIHNISFPYFQHLGLHIYSIEYDMTEESIRVPLSKEEILQNRSVLQNQYSRANILLNIEKMIKRLNL